MVGLWRLWCLQQSLTCSMSVSLGISLTVLQANRCLGASWRKQAPARGECRTELSLTCAQVGSRLQGKEFCHCHSYPNLASTLLVLMLLLCTIRVHGGTWWIMLIVLLVIYGDTNLWLVPFVVATQRTTLSGLEVLGSETRRSFSGHFGAAKPPDFVWTAATNYDTILTPEAINTVVCMTT